MIGAAVVVLRGAAKYIVAAGALIFGLRRTREVRRSALAWPELCA